LCILNNPDNPDGTFHCFSTNKKRPIRWRINPGTGEKVAVDSNGDEVAEMHSPFARPTYGLKISSCPVSILINRDLLSDLHRLAVVVEDHSRTESEKRVSEKGKEGVSSGLTLFPPQLQLQTSASL
jgi:hypothetical protein